jgi:hypothetical protein
MSAASQDTHAHVYTLNRDETQEWLQAGAEGEECREFIKRVVAANLPRGARIEIYSAERRLLEAFTVS